jgi:hypothetical protein
VLAGDVPAIHTIKGDVHIIVGEELRLPLSVTRGSGTGKHGLDAHHPRAMTRERESLQHIWFGAFDIDGHHVDGGEVVLVKDVVK